MAETGDVATHHAGSFLTQKTGNLPNWVWLVVIVGGVGGAILLPKLLGGQNQDQQNQDQSQNPNANQNPYDSGQGSSGLGLAIDPTTGLPYAVEGLVPSGSGLGGAGVTGTTGTQTVDLSGITKLFNDIEKQIKKLVKDETASVHHPHGTSQGHHHPTLPSGHPHHQRHSTSHVNQHQHSMKKRNRRG